MNSVGFHAGADHVGASRDEAAHLKTQPANRVVSPGSAQTSRSLWLMKKTVLLVDVDSATRDTRSKVMRTLGVTVHCAATVTTAWQKLDAGSYNLVLVDLGSDVERARAFVKEVRAKNPRQLVAFLVGSPLFVATSLDGRPAVSLRLVPARTEPAQNGDSPAPVFNFGQKIREAEAKEIA
jgi:CheY-like chemotaxis protein